MLLCLRMMTFFVSLNNCILKNPLSDRLAELETVTIMHKESKDRSKTYNRERKSDSAVKKNLMQKTIKCNWRRMTCYNFHLFRRRSSTTTRWRCRGACSSSSAPGQAPAPPGTWSRCTFRVLFTHLQSWGLAVFFNFFH